MRVAIDVRVRPGQAGGVAPAVHSLIKALGSQPDGHETYTIVIGSDEQADWLSPLSARQSFARRPASKRHPVLRPVWPLVRRVQESLSVPRQWPEVPLSDGFFERLGCDLIHFPTQSFTVCALPSVYNPIDLQHLHYPQFFDSWTIAWRETVYRAGCSLAQALIVNSDWIKQDLIRHYRVDASKVHIVPEASPVIGSTKPSEQLLSTVRSRYNLGEAFVLYPAVTWPHKNHLRLFEALAHLRDHRGLRLLLVCSGSRYEPFWPEIGRALERLELGSQVKFVGHIPGEDLRALYQLSHAMVLPSLFEANSLPVFEAWEAGTPVACSNVTGLPEQVGDAALLFDPTDPAAIGEALALLVTNTDLRNRLRTLGQDRAASFTWDRTARAYRALYRKTAGRELTGEDRALLGLA